MQWGQLLHEAAMPVAHTANVLQAWAQDRRARRSPLLRARRCHAGSRRARRPTSTAAREAATLLLGLPWELLHDGDGYPVPGREADARPPPPAEHAVARRAGRRHADPHPARHRAAGGRGLRLHRPPRQRAAAGRGDGGARRPRPLHVLEPADLAGAAQGTRPRPRARQPYHVVHFDGHGVYDRRVGLGGLCFEDPQDTDKLEKRRHVTVYTNDSARCCATTASRWSSSKPARPRRPEKASESVASELLKVGVASVVAMSHSVLVETARRFVEAFYAALAARRARGRRHARRASAR